MKYSIFFISFAALASHCQADMPPPPMPPSYAQVPSMNTKMIYDDIYKNISGFSIDEQERKNIHEKGGNPTYGEITYDGVEELIKKLNPTQKDVFYDLGSGVGKMAIHMAVATPVGKSVGVELSTTRHNHAMNALQNLSAKKIKPKGSIEFQNKDFLDVDLSDATIIYMASTCFSENLMRSLADRLSKLKKGLRVITLKKFPEPNQFKLIATHILPMTWSSNTSAYVYELE